MTTASPGALAGRRVAVTRAADQGTELLALLRARGATPISAPTIAVEPPASFAPLDVALRSLGAYDWVIFTSANAVAPFADRLQALGLALPESVRIGAVGAATASVVGARLRGPDFVPRVALGESLAAEIDDVSGRRVLFPRGDIAGDALPRGLRGRGATVDEVVVYRTVAGPGAAELARLVRGGGVDAILFMSASSVRHFVAALGVSREHPPAFGGVPVEGREPPAIVCIGPETARAAREAGLSVSAVAAEKSAAGVVDALEQWFERGSRESNVERG